MGRLTYGTSKVALYVKLPIPQQCSCPYPAAMVASARARPAFKNVCLFLGLAIAATPGSVAATPRAQLVHCGDETCLRISGHRRHSAVIVRIAGHNLAVEGARSWHAVVPLRTARSW